MVIGNLAQWLRLIFFAYGVPLPRRAYFEQGPQGMLTGHGLNPPPHPPGQFANGFALGVFQSFIQLTPVRNPRSGRMQRLEPSLPLGSDGGFESLPPPAIRSTKP